MFDLTEYIQKTSGNIMGTEEVSQIFINFYLYFKKLHERKLISDNTIYFLDSALDFSEPIFEGSHETEEYLNAKQFQIEQFLAGIRTSYDKIIKNFKKTFNIPKSYSYEDVCHFIKQSYISYAIFRYNINLKNTKEYLALYKEDRQFYKLPKYIPETNANISEFLEIVIGIKKLSTDGKSYEWFNVFNENLNIRVIVDISDGQIVSLFIDGEEYTDVPLSFIKQIKKHIKDGTPFSEKQSSYIENNKLHN